MSTRRRRHAIHARRAVRLAERAAQRALANTPEARYERWLAGEHDDCPGCPNCPWDNDPITEDVWRDELDAYLESEGA